MRCRTWSTVDTGGMHGTTRDGGGKSGTGRYGRMGVDGWMDGECGRYGTELVVD